MEATREVAYTFSEAYAYDSFSAFFLLFHISIQLNTSCSALAYNLQVIMNLSCLQSMLPNLPFQLEMRRAMRRAFPLGKGYLSLA